MNKQERVAELEERQTALSEELEKIESELETLNAEIRKAELELWAQKHGVSYEQTQSIPISQEIHDYFFHKIYGNHRNWQTGQFCNAKFATNEGLYCRWKAPDWGECSDLIPTKLILDALKVTAK